MHIEEERASTIYPMAMSGVGVWKSTCNGISASNAEYLRPTYLSVCTCGNIFLLHAMLIREMKMCCVMGDLRVSRKCDIGYIAAIGRQKDFF